jgi:hypothetical protein
MLAGKALAAHDAHHLLKLDALMADWRLAKFLDQILAAGIDTRHGHALQPSHITQASPPHHASA